MIDYSYSLAGALTGLIVGLTGVGGGALMTPLLLLFFGVSPVTAIATDLWFAAITKIVATTIHNKKGQVDWQVVKRLWLGSLPSTALIVILVSMSHEVVKMTWLTSAISVVVFVTAIGLLFAKKLNAFATQQRTQHAQNFKRAQKPLTVLAGAILGLCVSLTSVGAGAIGSVMLLFLYPFRMTPHRLVATDIVHAIPLAVFAGLGYLIAGKVDYWMLASLLLGSLPAVLVGSLIAGKMPARLLQIMLALVLMIIAIKMI